MRAARGAERGADLSAVDPDGLAVLAAAADLAVFDDPAAALHGHAVAVHPLRVLVGQHQAVHEASARHWPPGFDVHRLLEDKHAGEARALHSMQLELLVDLNLRFPIARVVVVK